jgi:extradiol dioxygenase family protein
MAQDKKKAVPWVASVAVVVSDKEKAKKWYSEKLGLDIISEKAHWVTVGKKGKGGQIHLCQMTEIDSKFPLEPGNSGILFMVEGDIVKHYETLKARGVEFPQPPVKRPWGWECVFRDLDGNEHMIMPST